jgi:CRISPR-associated protein Cmr4
MDASTKVYWLHCLAPTHVGTGRGVGYIDLPVYREKITNWPAFPGSSFKGVWADYYRATEKRRQEDKKLRLAFGTAGDSGSNAGALIPTDARLLCLPVRSFKGTFAWCTSRLALRLLQRDLTLSGLASPDALPPAAPQEEEPQRAFERKAFVCPGSSLKEGKNVYLEDLDFEADEADTAVKAWAEKIAEWVFPSDADAGWRAEFVSRFAVLADVIFDYLTVTATEVVTRVRIDDETKTVAEGQLWTEEALPAESILAGLVSCDRVYQAKSDVTPQALLADFATQPLQLQIGGKASVGRGGVRCVFTP